MGRRQTIHAQSELNAGHHQRPRSAQSFSNAQLHYLFQLLHNLELLLVLHVSRQELQDRQDLLKLHKLKVAHD